MVKNMKWLSCFILLTGCGTNVVLTEKGLTESESDLVISEEIETEEVKILPVTSTEDETQETLNQNETEVDLQSVAKIPGEDSPFSYKSFLNQDFNGADFKVGNLLTDWGTHKSYYATYNSDGFKVSATWHVPNGNGPFPVLILNHGYFPPSEYTNGYGFGREQKYFAKQGYAVLHIDYKGYAQSDPLPENQRLWGDATFATDAINAALALNAADLDFVDTERMGLFGHSLGGGVTLSAALARPDLFKVGVMWGPVSSDYFDNFNQWRRDDVSETQKLLFEAVFGSVDEKASFAALSPYPYLNQLEVPLLIQHGTVDESCPVEWSQSTVAQLQDLGKSVEYIEYDGYPHVFWNQNWDNAIEDTRTFIEPFLNPNS